MKRVTNAGTFRVKHKLLFIANALKQHQVGLEETDDGMPLLGTHDHHLPGVRSPDSRNDSGQEWPKLHWIGGARCENHQAKG